MEMFSPSLVAIHHLSAIFILVLLSRYLLPEKGKQHCLLTVIPTSSRTGSWPRMMIEGETRCDL